MLYIIIMLWLLAVDCWRLTGVPFPFEHWAVAFYFFIPSSSALFTLPLILWFCFARFLHCHFRFLGFSDLKLFSIPVINSFCLRYAYIVSYTALAIENGFVCIHSQYHKSQHIIFICPNNERHRNGVTALSTIPNIILLSVWLFVLK